MHLISAPRNPLMSLAAVCGAKYCRTGATFGTPALWISTRS